MKNTLNPASAPAALPPAMRDEETARAFYATRAAMCQHEFTAEKVAELVNHVLFNLTFEPDALEGVDVLETPRGHVHRLPEMVAAAVNEHAPEILEAVRMEVCHAVNQIHKFAKIATR